MIRISGGNDRMPVKYKWQWLQSERIPPPQLHVTTPTNYDSCNNWAAASAEELGRGEPPTSARCGGGGPFNGTDDKSFRIHESLRTACLHLADPANIHTHIHSEHERQWAMKFFSMPRHVFKSMLFQIYCGPSNGSP